MNVTKLKLNKDFRRIYGRGRSFVSPYFVTYLIKKSTGEIRLGLTAGKKLGNAVSRNRAKRVLSAAFRENAPHISVPLDVVLVARSRILRVKSTVVAADLAEHLRLAGVWEDSV